MKLLVHLLKSLSRPYRKGHLLHADGSAYMERYSFFETPFLSARLHGIRTPDLDPDCHDHPWAFISILVSGWYIEARPLEQSYPVWRLGSDGHEHELCFERLRDAPSVAFRRATDRHRITAVSRETWTIFIYFRARTWWGFYPRRGKVHWKEYNSIHQVLPEAWEKP